jgi:putative membrane protein
MMSGWYDNNWLWPVVMTVVMLGILGLVAAALAELLHPAPVRMAPAGSPLGEATRVLAERYARGEIDAGEYEARVETLRRAASANGKAA